MKQAARALAADVALILLFVVIGRGSHGEAGSAAGLARTAWPFLVGLLVGWLVGRVPRRPLGVLPEGVAVWLSTVVLGMLLRVAGDQGVAPSFVVVASLVLGLFLVGWRALLQVVHQRREHTGDARRPRRTGTGTGRTRPTRR